MINRILFIVLFLIIGFSLIYFFQIKPSEIRKTCDEIAWKEGHVNLGYDSYWKKDRIEFRKEEYDWKYNQCLHNQGLR